MEDPFNENIYYSIRVLEVIIFSIENQISIANYSNLKETDFIMVRGAIKNDDLNIIKIFYVYYEQVSYHAHIGHVANNVSNHYIYLHYMLVVIIYDTHSCKVVIVIPNSLSVINFKIFVT